MAGLFVPVDGRLTSQNVFTGPFDGTEITWLVAPGNVAEGNTFQVSVTTLAGFFGGYALLNSELITAGATVGSPYQVLTTDTAILFKKTLGSASFAVCPTAATVLYGHPILFKDLNGDASTNNITVTFTGSELCDGDSEVQITNDYGWFTIAPVPGGGAWYRLG